MSDSHGETVIVRDRDSLRQLAAADAWTAMTLVAALSADPRTMDELARAWLRYQPEVALDSMPWTECPGEPNGGSWLLLDLACLRVVAPDRTELPENLAAFQRDEGPWNPEIPVVWINLPPDWQLVAVADWHQALPPLPVPREPLDARGVLFGRQLAEGIARRALQLARQESLPTQRVGWSDLESSPSPTRLQRETASRWHALTVRVHADWIMTPREDLDGKPPRHFLHSGRDWVDHELGNRQQQWSSEGRCPRPLDRDTFAYRFGPLGRQEVVMYFDLCREVIDTAWDRIVATPSMHEETLTTGLYDHAQWWLANGSIDGDPTPPATIIENERRRAPLVADGNHLDCDCPICRMEADSGNGPTFWLFDGHHLELDDEFAFSLCATRDEWEREQGQYHASDEALEAAPPNEMEDGDSTLASVWTKSFVNQEVIQQAGTSSQLALMGLAMRMAELVDDLTAAGNSRGLINTLNEAFDGYRAAEGDAPLAAAAIARLENTLEQIAAAHPRLTPKVADLQSQFVERQRKIESDPSA